VDLECALFQTHRKRKFVTANEIKAGKCGRNWRNRRAGANEKEEECADERAGEEMDR
jgi:hypothetical protein